MSWFISVLCSLHLCFMLAYVASTLCTANLKLGNIRLLILFFLNIDSAILVSLVFYINLNRDVSVCAESVTENSMGVLTRPSLQAHQHGIASHYLCHGKSFSALFCTF